MDGSRPGEGEGPLSSEELARDEWREDRGRVSEADAPGHTLPASEADAEQEGGADGPKPIGGTMLPPD